MYDYVIRQDLSHNTPEYDSRRGSRVKVFWGGYWELGRYVRGSEATERGEGVGGGNPPPTPRDFLKIRIAKLLGIVIRISSRCTVTKKICFIKKGRAL